MIVDCCRIRPLGVVDPGNAQTISIDVIVLWATTPEISQGLRSYVSIEEIVAGGLSRLDPTAQAVISVVPLCAGTVARL
jgi:hypothetical protein